VKVIWSPRANERVVEIGEYIVAQGRPDAAADWVVGILASVKRLRRFPRSGRMVPERKRDDLREVVHGSYRVIYRIDPDKI
jgi:plasmid stabilization system protein ParE